MKREREDKKKKLQCKSSKSSADESLPKISINTRLAAEILLLEANKGSSGKNVVCSPLSLEFALHMVAAGSKGETLSQILNFIGSKDYPLESMEDLNLKSSGIMEVASSFCKSDKKNVKMKRFGDEEAETEPELSFANGVWVDRKYKLKRSYKELMSSIYNARAEKVHFESEGNQIAEDINSWVADKTKGVIKKIMAPGSIGANTSLILVNALYFKGFWSDSFAEDMTVDKDFHLLNGSKISVPFMSRPSPRYLYGAFDDFKVVQVDYSQYISKDDVLRRVCMEIFLPNEKDGLQNLMNKCMSDPSLLHQGHRLNYEKFKKFLIPKFKFTYMNDHIVATMKSLGLTRPFEEHCEDFTEMVKLKNGEKIYVSDIIHKATIEVNESNTVAAAATTDAWIRKSRYRKKPPPPTFVADHPFMFAIKELNSGVILFMGAVFNPLLED